MATEYPSLISLLAHQDGARPAFEYLEKEDHKQISYQDLLQRIKDYPLPHNNVIGLFANTAIDSVIALCSLLGKRRLVLLNPDDPIETLIAQIEATHIGILIGDDELAEELSSHLDKDYVANDQDVLFFTSGTTSKAKAVILSESSLLAAAYEGGSLLPLNKEDRLLAVLPLSHVFGLVCSLLWPLSFGATVCLGRGLRYVFFDYGIYRPTVTTLVPQMAGFLVSKDLLNPELKLILIGAGECPDAVLNAIKAKGIRVSFGYGLTESSSGIALSLGDDPHLMSICPGYTVKIASDHEILVYHPKTLMKGYYQDKEATKNTIIGGYLHTGDLGTIEHGYLRIQGRKKEILVFADGSKLFLPEYEAELAARLGQDADFAIIQRKDKTVALYIHKPTNVEDIIEAFNLAYPRSHRIATILYSDTPLPRTKTGKVQRYLIHHD